MLSIGNLPEERLVAPRSDQARVLNAHISAYPQDSTVVKFTMSRPDSITVEPGQNKTLYTEGLITCPVVTTVSRVVGHPDCPDNTMIANASHDSESKQKRQISTIKALITENKLKEYGKGHAVFISLAERSELSTTKEETEQIFDQINAALGGNAQLVSLPHAREDDTLKWEDRALIFDISNDNQMNHSISYDLFAEKNGKVSI